MRVDKPVVHASVVAGGVDAAEARELIARIAQETGEVNADELTELFAKDASAARAKAWELVRADVAAPAVEDGKGSVTWENHTSPYTVKEVGERPEGGWPLFIAMHGGGGVPKEVNDSHGHASGDELLIVLAGRMKAAIRESEPLARMSGDEFAAVLEELDDLARAQEVAEQSRQRLEQAELLGGELDLELVDRAAMRFGIEAQRARLQLRGRLGRR